MSDEYEVTRETIERDYTVINGVIRSPGKFEMEPVWAPFFWDRGMNGFWDDEEEDDTWAFEVSDFDRIQFPELDEIGKVFLKENDYGFVYSWTEGTGEDDDE